jgi:hypothetical protein
MRRIDEEAAARAEPGAGALHFKDEILDRLGEVANVAQFVSFSPQVQQRYARVHGFAPNHLYESTGAAVGALLKAAPDGTVNVRSFMPDDPKSREFIYGLKDVHEVVAHVRRLAATGLFTIVNETIDVNDGGVSGVLLGDVLEFAPGDTPRCVEKPGTASLARSLGLGLLETIYNFRPRLDYPPTQRVEFSLHPLRRGYLHDHTIIWELETFAHTEGTADTRWPNRFSRFIGDKTFGLLMADALGLPVPATMVIPRFLAPFRFGRETGTGEIWFRTCPVEQVPGKFTTQRGWTDPFKLMAEEDSTGTAIASVLAQESVEAAYSGALVSTAAGEPIIEGVCGAGEEFMVGRIAPQQLPDKVQDSVRRLYEEASRQLGPVRFEWVYDGKLTWVVQLHRGATATSGRTVYPGEANKFRQFKVADGIDALRALISEVQETGEGIILVGDVGVTSHLGDLLRRAKIPSRIEPLG